MDSTANSLHQSKTDMMVNFLAENDRKDLELLAAAAILLAPLEEKDRTIEQSTSDSSFQIVASEAPQNEVVIISSNDVSEYPEYSDFGEHSTGSVKPQLLHSSVSVSSADRQLDLVVREAAVVEFRKTRELAVVADTAAILAVDAVPSLSKDKFGGVYHLRSRKRIRKVDDVSLKDSGVVFKKSKKCGYNKMDPDAGPSGWK